MNKYKLYNGYKICAGVDHDTFRIAEGCYWNQLTLYIECDHKSGL